MAGSAIKVIYVAMQYARVACFLLISITNISYRYVEYLSIFRLCCPNLSGANNMVMTRSPDGRRMRHGAMPQAAVCQMFLVFAPQDHALDICIDVHFIDIRSSQLEVDGAVVRID